MVRQLLLFIFIATGLNCIAQKVKNVSATYIYYAPETITLEEAKKVALDRAKIQAVADEFGTIISQSNSTVITNKNGESNIGFISIGGSDVKGEWIETIDEPKYDISYEQDQLIIVCSVKGKARELISAGIEFVAKPLRNGTSLKYESNEFRDGDDMYLYFQSPIDGFLSVFFVDEVTQMVYCILPYRNSDGKPMQVKADKQYILFSKEDGDVNEQIYIDEYVLTANNDFEYNDYYILFSPEQYTKALLRTDDSEMLPKTISLRDFQKWLAQTKIQNTRLSLQKITIKISK